MTHIFISYAHRDASKVTALADLMGNLIHDANVWYDQRLVGGQDWWDEILRNIENCDIFVFVLSPSSVASVFCRVEFQYALALNKRILPIKLKEAALPGKEISEFQYVEVRNLKKQETVAQISRSLDYLQQVPKTSFAEPSPKPKRPELPELAPSPPQSRSKRSAIAVFVLALIALAGFAITMLGREDYRAQARAMGPLSQVEIAEATLAVEQAEVTIGRYRLCVDYGPCAAPSEQGLPGQGGNPYFEAGNDDLPVSGVDLAQSALFCEWIGRRLPTVTEWRAVVFGVDRDRAFPWGDAKPTENYANLFYQGDANFAVQPVATTPEGVYMGIHDLIGNVSEWAINDTVESDADPIRNAEAVTVGGNASTPLSDGQNDLGLEEVTTPSSRLPTIGIRCVTDN